MGGGQGLAETADGDLVRRFQQGKEEAFVSLMERHERRVYNLAYRMLGNPEDARDATQDAFLSCYRNLSRFRGDAAFTTWLHRIAVNACYDSIRRRRDTTSLDAIAFEPRPSEDHADQTAAAADVQRALMTIPADFRLVVVMHELQDMPLDEISACLDVPVGTVKSRLHRGRVALGRALAERRSEEPGRVSAPSKPPNP